MVKSQFFKLIGLLFLLSGNVWGQSPAANGYRQDLAFLKQTLQDSYPSLYRFRSKASIDKVFEKCAAELDSTATMRDFYKTTRYLLSYIRDGHLGCKATDSLERRFDEKEKCFPLTLYFTGNKAYVDCAHNEHFPPGTEITDINGMSMRSIRKNLFRYMVSDGRIETKKYCILNRNFWFYYNLVYGPQAEYKVTYRQSSGKWLTTSLNGELRDNMKCKSFSQATGDTLLQIKYLDRHTALLTIRTFDKEALTEAGLNFEQFLEAAFAGISEKQTASLIIDLRGNGGGKDTYGALLFSYLTDQPFRYYERLETAAGALSEADHPNLALQQPMKDHFAGKLYVLIDGLSFSATSEFCTVAKDHGRAVFIGEETGGTYCGNTSGAFKEVLLPFSGFTVYLPTTKYVMATKNKRNKDRGIVPDHIIKPAIADLIEKKDVQLHFAIEMAQRK